MSPGRGGVLKTVVRFAFDPAPSALTNPKNNPI